jgi:YVTN family beta-propeller protein
MSNGTGEHRVHKDTLADPFRKILSEKPLLLTERRLLWLFLVFTFAALSLPGFAQQVIATIPVGSNPQSAAVNPVTNHIYVANNACGNMPPCPGPGSVSVIIGTTNNTVSVNVGFSPDAVAVNSLTNKIYVVNNCGNDPTCASNGTVTVIDGATNNVTATVTVGSNPYGVAVNSVTNKIYVANICGSDPTCQTYSGTVTVIDGATFTVAASVPIGANPYAPVVNSVTNQIYVPNACGNDPTCGQPYIGGTVTVIDGATYDTNSVDVGILPDAVDIDTTANQIYVANECGDDPYCASTATMTAIDGTSLMTTDVPIGGYYPFAIEVNSVTHEIYVPSSCWSDPSCQGEANGTVSVIDGSTLRVTANVAVENFPNSMAINSVTNKIYIANQCGNDPYCQSPNGTVTVIDGATLATTNIGVGDEPYGPAVDSATDRIYVPNLFDNTVSVINGTPPTALQFVPLAQPCRAVDTRPQNGGSGPIQGGTHQNFTIAGAPNCGIPASAAAYSMNVSVVPEGPLGYLTVWPTGHQQPVVSTLNSLDGRIKANAAIVPAGTNGAISVYATNTTNVILDVDGYFMAVSGSTLAFYPLVPCRVADTRNGTFPQGLGPPFLTGLQERDFPILSATSCNIPSTAAAYSLNFSVVPHGPLYYMTVWPYGQPRPLASTLNDIPGTIIANAAIVVAGTGGEVSVYPTNDTDLIIDINGYFAATGPGGLSLYGVQPCRVIDTRKVGAGLPFSGTLSPPVDVVDTGCATSSLAQAYVFNASVVPTGGLGYLTLWPDGTDRPVVSTLSASDGSISSNMAIVPTNNGSIDAYASGITQLILDISSYFAP